MAAAQSMEQVYKVRLRVMVDKESNKVLYVESGKDFVDALFGFLTLSLGTIARLVAKDSNIEAVRVGSLSSLYQSIADLDEQYLSTHACKEILLNPRNSMEPYCKQLKLNINDTVLSENTDSNQKRGFGKVMNRVLSPSPQPGCLRLENGFVKENATFIISDDLSVMPNVFGSVVHLHQKHKITNFEAVLEQNVEITKREVVDILKLSMTSKTPLTDFIFRKKHVSVKHKYRNQTELKLGEVTSNQGRQMSVKVVRQKSTRKILFAEAGVDFIDFIFSFQTFPLGGVLHMLEGVSSLECIDNLYKSVANLSPDIYLMSQNVKEKLSKPLVKSSFGSGDGGYHGDSFLPLKLIDSMFSASNSSVLGKFAKGASMFMVTDDLVVTPISSFNAISYLNSLNVSMLDVEERVVKIGLKEGLSILKTSLTSTSALTNGLGNVFDLGWRSFGLRSVLLIVVVAFAVDVGRRAKSFYLK
ncbi:unnamed protein product [Lathyrus oleraceus]